MENQLDAVESGKEDYRRLLAGFYKGFDAELQKAEQEPGRVKVPDEETDVVCELCGRKMVIKSSRFGKFLACPGYPECKNTKPMAQDTGFPCPKCGAKLLKKKSKSGFNYYGCERNPVCDFMTWDTPQPGRQCPQCGGAVYRHFTKEDKRNLCHVPGCGWSEPIVSKSRKKADDSTGGAAKQSATAAAENPDMPETTSTAKKTAAKKTTAKTTAKKTTAKKSTAKKPAAKAASAKKAAATTKKASSKTPAPKRTPRSARPATPDAEDNA
jgi:DNA topoisomerase-1